MALNFNDFKQFQLEYTFVIKDWDKYKAYWHPVMYEDKSFQIDWKCGNIHNK